MSDHERDALAEVLGEHEPSGRVNSREGWVECSCDARLTVPSGLDRAGFPNLWAEEEQARHRHVADAILASGWLAARDRRVAERVLREAAESFDWLAAHVSDKADCADVAERLRDRAARIEGGGR